MNGLELSYSDVKNIVYALSVTIGERRGVIPEAAINKLERLLTRLETVIEFAGEDDDAPDEDAPDKEEE